jgi:hypothetical protein
MEKTIFLPPDKFERAATLDKFLSEGWTIRYDPDDASLAVIYKKELNEDFGRPQLLLD